MPKVRRKKMVIGLTGGIATGKSFVLSEFKKCGVKTFDCDQIVHQIQKPGQKGWKAIIRTFGQGILLPNGVLNRPQLAQNVFKDRRTRKKLESLMHPMVLNILLKKIRAIKKGLIAVDVPLLFESGWKKHFDSVTVVWSSAKIQTKRLMKRNHLSKTEAARLIRSQWPTLQKRNAADFVIDNTRSLKNTGKQARNLIRYLYSRI